MKQHKLLNKILVIGALAVLLYIPLISIQGVIQERQTFRTVARSDIAQSWTGEQLVAGPLLAVPYQVEVVTTVREGKRQAQKEKVSNVWKTFYLAPDELRTESRVETQLRYRGIHGVPVYTAGLQINGGFSTGRLLEFAAERDDILQWGEPYLSVGISDSRGIANRPTLHWNGRKLPFEPGARSGHFKQGLHAETGPVAADRQQEFRFSYALQVRGMEKLSFTPTGLNTEVSLASDWEHPSFLGKFLPEQRQSSADGFSAEWRISSFATDIENTLRKANEGRKASFSSQTFGVSLIEPVDVYLQSERSVKYGLLFIGLTFVAFFLFEVLKRLPIHPIQYTLVGMALSFFYLLLVAFSEHIGFGAAYLLGTAACSGLLAVYTGSVLHNGRLGGLLGSIIALLYGMLYVIIRSEDLALLMGSLLLFGMLALVMLSTRKLDWYEVGERMSTLKRVPEGT